MGKKVTSILPKKLEKILTFTSNNIDKKRY